MIARSLRLLLLLAPGFLLAQNNPDGSGRWTLTADVFRTSLHFPLELSQDGEQLTGNFAGAKLTGTVQGNSVQFVAKDEDGGTRESRGTLKNNVISGSL